MTDRLTKFLLSQALGEIMVWALSVPIPGSVIAILLLACYLLGREAEVEKIAAFSNQFFGHFAMFLFAGRHRVF
jgi:putative effector of murein hydrolase LrgA (UPF0299 family)